MNSSYTVTFELEDWMSSGLNSGKYYIKGGNLLKAENNAVVKWLKPVAVQSAGSFMQNALMATSLINAAVGIATLMEVRKVSELTKRCIGEIQANTKLTKEVYHELVRSQILRPLSTGVAAFDTALSSNNAAHYLREAIKELLKVRASFGGWLDGLDRSSLLSEMELIEQLCVKVSFGAILEAKAHELLDDAGAKHKPIHFVTKSLTVLHGKLSEIQHTPQLPHSTELLGLPRVPGLMKHTIQLSDVLAEFESLSDLLLSSPTHWELNGQGRLVCEYKKVRLK